MPSTRSDGWPPAGEEPQTRRRLVRLGADERPRARRAAAVAAIVVGTAMVGAAGVAGARALAPSVARLWRQPRAAASNPPPAPAIALVPHVTSRPPLTAPPATGPRSGRTGLSPGASPASATTGRSAAPAATPSAGVFGIPSYPGGHASPSCWLPAVLPSAPPTVAQRLADARQACATTLALEATVVAMMTQADRSPSTAARTTIRTAAAQLAKDAGTAAAQVQNDLREAANTVDAQPLATQQRWAQGLDDARNDAARATAAARVAGEYVNGRRPILEPVYATSPPPTSSPLRPLGLAAARAPAG